MKALYFLILDFYKYIINKTQAIHSSRTTTSAIIFGNGPSLNDFLNAYGDTLDIYDTYVCNGFAKTKQYRIIKPRFYCLLDPLYFDLHDPRVIDQSVAVTAVWEAIFSLTDWPIIIYTSQTDIDQKKKDIIDKFGSNEWISWINLNPVKFHGKHKYCYYSKNIGLVEGMTVTHLSLQIAILNKYETVYLAGVDHNWIENIRYDNELNKVYLFNKHFYGEEKLYYNEGILANMDLESEFASLSRSFHGFKELLKLADIAGVRVYRCTKSFLDFIPFREL